MIESENKHQFQKEEDASPATRCFVQANVFTYLIVVSWSFHRSRKQLMFRSSTLSFPVSSSKAIVSWEETAFWTCRNSVYLE